ncbi:MAG TPA: toll/interleukin-1 receptor domain-containing protein [Chthoniobacter sp.]|nr:toll/interleukin-1 receptor domain-containing protein [Chthoniobacter sp.]
METLANIPPHCLFISHATPADNEITQWLGLRLMREGYAVWFDTERLLVGDDFWREIENQIRNKSAKFILVLSKTAVTREGVLQEIAVAKKVAKIRPPRFILPVRADDLSFDDIPIEVNRLDVADFSKSWSFGLSRLLKILEEDKVPCTPGEGPQAAADRWRADHKEPECVTQEREEYSSNRFTLSQAPKRISFHRLADLSPFDKTKFKAEHPTYKTGEFFVSFASAGDLAPSFAKADATLGSSFAVRLGDFLSEGLPAKNIKPREAQNIVTYLMREAFHTKLQSLGMQRYDLSGKGCYYWFPESMIAPRKQVHFTRHNKTTGGRSLVGSKNVKDRTGTVLGKQGWHFGIEVIPFTWPILGFHVRSHVAFTSNGVVIADSAKQHKLRRRECKVWFNDRWADMLLAAMSQLSGGEHHLDLPLGTGAFFRLGTMPESFISPVRFAWEKDGELPPYQPDEEPADVVVDDDDDDDEEDVDE